MSTSTWNHHANRIRFFLIFILEIISLPLLAGTTSRVSVSTFSAQADDDSGYGEIGGISMSSDGRYVAFMSSATNLHPDSYVFDYPQVYVRDRTHNITHWVSRNFYGRPVTATIRNTAVSDNGTFVVYDSSSRQIVANDENYAMDVFLYNVSNGTTERVSLTNDGNEGTYGEDSQDADINDDGTKIVFESYSHNMVPDQRNNLLSDIFLRDTENGTTIQINVSSSGDQASGGNSYNPSISASGRWVAFESRATNLVSNDTNLVRDIFVRDTELGTTERVSVNSSGVAGNAGSYNPAISADGRYVAFESLASNLVANDNNNARDVFVHDRQENITYRVSISSSGGEIGAETSARYPSISASGRFVTFHSTSRFLVDDDDNYDIDIFVHDLQRRTTERVSVDSNGGQANNDSTYPVISANGTVVAFQSIATNLITNDTNGKSDVFVHVNSPPVAVIAGPTDNVECTGSMTRIDLDGSGSYDPQGEPLSYYWTLADGDHNTAPSVIDFVTLGDTTFSLRVTDPYGLTNTDELNVSVVDNTAPVISPFNDVTLEATSTEGAYYRVSVSTAQYWDRCNSDGNLSVQISPVGENDYYPLGTTPVTVTVTDPYDNSASETFDIIVQDTTPPELTSPPDKTVEATAIMTPVYVGQATATDIFGPVTITHDAPSHFGLGTTPVTWTATDANGNSSTAVQRITVEDTTPPTITIPAPNITVEAQGVLTFVVIGIPIATDIFFPLSYAVDNAPPDLMFPLGTTDITWFVTDANGNSSTHVQHITVRDTTPPVITLPPDQTVEATAILTQVDIGQATAADIFGPVAISHNAPSNGFPLGTTEIVWIATDANGNSSSAVQRITVGDSTAPMLTIPPDLTVEATGPLTQVDIGQATATDIFEPVTISNNAPSDGYPLGTTEIVWTATDANGNSRNAVQQVTVLDRTAPSFELDRITDRLWPPNRRTVLVATVSDVYDAVDPSPEVNIEISVDETFSRRNHNDTAPDWEIISDGEEWQIWLRAELSHRADERVYTINIRVRDFSANQSTAVHVVTVSREGHENHDEDDDRDR